jgi:hypothetical protein
MIAVTREIRLMLRLISNMYLYRYYIKIERRILSKILNVCLSNAEALSVYI